MKIRIFPIVLLPVLFLCGCRERQTPDQVTTAYFDCVAGGEPLAVKPYLTPDGQESLRGVESNAELVKQLKSHKAEQVAMWRGIRRKVSPPRIEGDRAEVDFTAEIPGKGGIVYTIILFRIHDEWKISMISVCGPAAVEFQKKLMALKTAGTAEKP